ncbi:class A beta-lactamase-related serine hydrolase [Burkholderia cepacia]|uniref:Class A beta-lactamase-related serine hydrolase n=1 Tax=Burkholderia cepacia TaxID=292 RepID=A0AAX2RPQ2_BURCE|nr:serine hydrolase domain-containing protein [Burkholderia cepacia]TES79088.1 class A beta-lactamase-related serine hydrolase [Burkholderia cepacia]TET01137.1 class A beta-lactamase-related serine hydrolase [Burkholderia cepacia]TEU46149.1 class A beta-lactamase-related serine hydrolase [Burkholderia cepacia]TEU47770.1 class A beta-lactamase-related serine hydrolase [Burkholderia cepacia]TEU51222.1 class A beta-lactamase-related serine hydrolase [Burkholderia cepacia]
MIPNRASSRQPSTDPALAERVDAVLSRQLETHCLVGAVVLIARDGELVYRRAAGFADREARTPMREDTQFRLASVTKPIVSTAAMALVAQHKLSLDDDVTRWLPGFRPALHDGSVPVIRVRHLLTHTAGLGYRFAEADATGPYARAGASDGLDAASITLAENLRRIASVPLQFAPGTGWNYSLSIDVVGALIEAVSGLPLADAIDTLVLRPLGARDTGFVARDPARLATPYVNDTPQPHRLAENETVPIFDGTVGVTYSPSRALDADAFPSGGAGMVGTAGDVLNVLDTLRAGGGSLLPADLVDEMGRAHTGNLELPDLPGAGFGIGFSVLRDPLAAASPESVGTWRWGGVYGHSWFVDRARGLTVVSLSNTLYEGMNGQYTIDLRDAIYGAG